MDGGIRQGKVALETYVSGTCIYKASLITLHDLRDSDHPTPNSCLFVLGRIGGLFWCGDAKLADL